MAFLNHTKGLTSEEPEYGYTMAIGHNILTIEKCNDDKDSCITFAKWLTIDTNIQNDTWEGHTKCFMKVHLDFC